VFADSAVGPTVPALYGGTIAVANAGAIEQRWAIVFSTTDPTQFDLYGESLGFVMSGNTSTTLAPVNPSTGAVYFSMAPGGWAGTIEIGNAFRFNTHGSLSKDAVWITRRVAKDPGRAPHLTRLTRRRATSMARC
jgi:hypothetical protein